MRIEFKFLEASSADERQLVIAQIKKLGVEWVEEMFPGEKDAELASLYKIEGVPEEQANDVVSTISGFAGVEYAEVAPTLRLIH